MWFYRIAHAFFEVLVLKVSNKANTAESYQEAHHQQS